MTTVDPEIFGLIVIRKRLELEIKMGMRSRVSTAEAARRVLGTNVRSKKKLLEMMNDHIYERTGVR